MHALANRLCTYVCVLPADTQLKKLVYLYLINYAKSNPDLTILAVNTFVKVRMTLYLVPLGFDYYNCFFTLPTRLV